MSPLRGKTGSLDVIFAIDAVAGQALSQPGATAPFDPVRQ
jgi:hypothetical protein